MYLDSVFVWLRNLTRRVGELSHVARRGDQCDTNVPELDAGTVRRYVALFRSKSQRRSVTLIKLFASTLV